MTETILPSSKGARAGAFCLRWYARHGCNVRSAASALGIRLGWSILV